MANAPRRRSETGVYHVVVRGNGRQVLFYDDADRQAFLAMLARRTSDAGMSIWAWCLMSNHVHMLLEDQLNELSHAMQMLLTGYARYFNDKTGHVGHVFQQRFFSEPIESDRYLMAAVRYVHINPEKDGIEAASTFDGAAMPSTRAARLQLRSRSARRSPCSMYWTAHRALLNSVGAQSSMRQVLRARCTSLMQKRFVWQMRLRGRAGSRT